MEQHGGFAVGDFQPGRRPLGHAQELPLDREIEVMHRIGILDVFKANAERAQSGCLRLRARHQRDSAESKRAVFRKVAAQRSILSFECRLPDCLERALDDAAVDAKRSACCCRGERASDVGD